MLTSFYAWIMPEICNIAFSVLVKPSIDAIEDFQSNSSLKQLNGAFSKLIQLLSLLLCWDIDVKGVAPCIKRWMKVYDMCIDFQQLLRISHAFNFILVVQVSCVQRFNKHLIENSNGGEITSRTFSKAISFLQKDLSMLYTCCKQEPLEDLGLFQTCASEYYELVRLQPFILIILLARLQRCLSISMTNIFFICVFFMFVCPIIFVFQYINHLLYDVMLFLIMSFALGGYDMTTPCQSSRNNVLPLSMQCLYA